MCLKWQDVVFAKRGHFAYNIPTGATAGPPALTGCGNVSTYLLSLSLTLPLCSYSILSQCSCQHLIMNSQDVWGGSWIQLMTLTSVQNEQLILYFKTAYQWITSS